MEKKLKILVLSIIFCIALAVRLFHIYPEFYSSDMVSEISRVTDAVPKSESPSLWPKSYSIDAVSGNPLLVLSDTYSPLGATIMMLNVLLFDSMGLIINETVWILPTILIGALTVVLVYFIGSHFNGLKGGLLGALFFILFPIHVWQSRYPTAGDTLGFFVQSLTVYAFLRYFYTMKRFWALVFGFSLGACFFSNLQWFGIFPLLIVSSVLLNDKNRKIFRRIKSALYSFWRWEIVLPTIIALIGLFIISILIGQYRGQIFGGSLGYLMKKVDMNELGVYIPFYIRHIISEAGPMVALLIPFFWAIGIIYILRLKLCALLWFWSLCYTLPYLFFVGPKTTSPANYYGPGLQAMTLFIAVCLSEQMDAKIIWRRAGAWIITVLILISCAYSNLITSYNLPIWNPLNLAGRTGNYVPTQGFKSAGYWIRHYSPQKAKIFAFEYGGMGMEPSVGHYYFDRITIGMYDAPSFDAILLYYKKYALQADYLVIRPRDYVLLKHDERKYFLYKIAEVHDVHLNILLEIYTRKIPQDLKILNDKIISRSFDKEFGHLRFLRGERKLFSVIKNFQKQ
jgi:hypothetical protein